MIPHLRHTRVCYGKHRAALLVRERLVRDLPLLIVLEIILSGWRAVLVALDLLLLRDRAPLHVREPPVG